jgi:hypothetical protein
MEYMEMMIKKDQLIIIWGEEDPKTSMDKILSMS